MKNTFFIAIVEDDEEAAERLTRYLERFGNENSLKFKVVCYRNATAFSVNSCQYDVIFMDIILPDGNGMEIVRELRTRDKDTLVIFVTNMVEYAVQGYEVRAFDFIVKPINYYNFSLKISDVLAHLQINSDDEIWINIKNERRKLIISRIKYVDIMNHYLTYHTLDGDFSTFGSIADVRKTLDKPCFALCNRCYLVNLKYVTALKVNSVVVDGDILQISRNKRAEFLKALNDYIAEGGTV